MDPSRQVRGAVRQNIVVHPDVPREQPLRVDARLVHALDSRLRAEERKRRVVELDVAAAEVVQLGELFPVRVHEVREVRVWTVARMRDTRRHSGRQSGAYRRPCTRRGRSRSPSRGGGASM